MKNFCTTKESKNSLKTNAELGKHAQIKYNYTKYGYTKDLEDDGIEAKLDIVPFFFQHNEKFQDQFQN